MRCTPVRIRGVAAIICTSGSPSKRERGLCAEKNCTAAHRIECDFPLPTSGEICGEILCGGHGAGICTGHLKKPKKRETQKEMFR